MNMRAFLHLWFLLLIFLMSLSHRAQAQPFYAAVRENRLEAVTRMLHSNPQLARAVADDGNTALHFAAHYGWRDITRLLLNAGADINATGRRTDRWTPLFCAASEGRTDETQFLLGFKAGFDVTDSSGNTPLHAAAERGQADAIRALLAAGANVNSVGARGDHHTPFMRAAFNGHLAAMRVLIARGADLDMRSSDGNAAIHYAARANRHDALELLVAVGTDINLPNVDGNTPLAVAAWYGAGPATRLLLAAGADMSRRNQMGQTALDEARRGGRQEIVLILTQYQDALAAKATLDQARQAAGPRAQSGFANWLHSGLQSHAVFKDDFAAAAPTSQWYTPPGDGQYSAPLRISTTPKGGRRFLGDFGNQEVRLTLQHLPPHQEVSVSFDLYIIRSWDGSNSYLGPDTWSLRVVDGPTLLTTTFANFPMSDCAPLKIQAYPGEYPGSHNATRTGSVENNTLGFSMPVDNIPTDMDSVYHLSYTFAHTGSALLLNFGAANLQGMTDESWGLANVQVSVGVSSLPAASTVRTAPHAAPTVMHPVSRVVPKLRARVAARHDTTAHTAKPTKNVAKTKPGKPAPRLHDRKKPPVP